MRQNIDVIGYAREIAKEFNQITQQNMVDLYSSEDMILAYSNATKDRITSVLKQKEGIQQKWIVTEKNAKYCNGDIVIGQRPHAQCEIRHAFTVHSVQGETVDNNLFISAETLVDNRLAYTAFSRARRYNQIFMIL
jgi:hypothetical protein